MKNQTDVDPDNLTDPELAMLDQVRCTMGPRSSDQMRVRVALSASLAAGSLGPKLPPETARLGANPYAKGISAGLRGLGWQALAAAFIASIGFGVGYWTGQRTGAPPTLAQTEAQAAPVVHKPELEQANDRIGERPPTVQASAGLPSPTTKPRGADTRLLTEEADALRRVGQALRDGQPGLAKQILDDLDARNPKGALLEERNAARLMVRCRNGDDSARAAAQTWLKRHPRSVYAPRVRMSCLAEDEP